MPGKLSDSVWIKIGLAIVPVALIITGALLKMWSDVSQMKSQWTPQERIIRLEEHQKAIDEKLAAQQEQLRAMWKRRNPEAPIPP